MMADYRLTIRALEPRERYDGYISRNLMEETLEWPEYGTVGRVEFEGADTAHVYLTGATDEIAASMDGRVYHGFPY
jgi:hypothetical protein